MTEGPLLYGFHQNNSGGHFIFDSEVGYEVFIEASSADEANDRAKEIGIYFDGCDDHRDCACCGDRWHRQYADDDVATLYNHIELELNPENSYDFWGGWCVVYYADDSRWYVTDDGWMWSDYEYMRAYLRLNENQ